MGQEQSTPSGDKFQPDFMTAHVKGVSKELAPQKKPFQGHSAVGADSLMMAAARKAQENVSGDSYSRPYQGLPSSMGADSYLLQEMKKVSTSNATTEEEDYKPSVGADSWLMTRQKKYATGQDNHVRNRFNLMDNHLAKGVDNTNYEMDFAASAKKVTKGARKQDWVGTAPQMKPDDYWLNFAKTTQTYNKPLKRDGVCMGIRPNHPKTGMDYLYTAQKELGGKVKDGSAATTLPVPQVDSESYMLAHAKQQTQQRALDSSPGGQRFDEDGPANHFSTTDNFTATKTAKAAEKTPAKAYQGVKAHLGPDTFMMNFSKTVAGFTPSKIRSRESQNKPPQEVTL